MENYTTTLINLHTKSYGGENKGCLAPRGLMTELTIQR